MTSLLLPKWSSDLKYGPCPPARDFGSRVSGLVRDILVNAAFAIMNQTYRLWGRVVGKSCKEEEKKKKKRKEKGEESKNAHE